MDVLQLKPCPFCGGGARMVMLAPGLNCGKWQSYVFCKYCGASTKTATADTRDQAIVISEQHWNERA